MLFRSQSRKRPKVSKKKSRSGNLNATPNITPMIDVLMVLLVIFMVISPAKQYFMDIDVPQKPKKQEQQPTPPPTSNSIVLTIDKDATIYINQEIVAMPNLENRIREIYMRRVKKLIFFQADGGLQVQTVITAIDLCKRGGVEEFASMPDSSAENFGKIEEQPETESGSDEG